MKELEILRSQRFIVYVCFFTVIMLTPNTYFVFHKFSQFIPVWREIHSAGVALIISSAIMIYTFRKNEPVALVFAWFEVGISTYYYVDNLGFTWDLIPAIGFACIMPYSVKKYTGELDINIESKKPPAEVNELMDQFPKVAASDLAK